MTKEWELTHLAEELRKVRFLLIQQLALCYQHIDENKHREAFEILVRVFRSASVDNIKILRHLICTKDEVTVLVCGKSKSRVQFKALRKKTVLLLISDLDVSQEELTIIDRIYRESRKRSEYEIIWLPVIDKDVSWTEEHQLRFELLQSMMSWYTLHNPNILEPATKRYIKEEWRFTKKTTLVVLDPRGKVACTNALNMFLIWGNLAFPFTATKEEILWREGTWKLDIFISSIDPSIHEWIKKGKHICVYGGEDAEWIKRFTCTARNVAISAGIELELIYIGKRNASKERIRRITTIIEEGNLSHYWSDVTRMNYFWTRLESMFLSKIKPGKDVETDDLLLTEVYKLFGLDESGKGWDTFWYGSEMAQGKWDIILKSLEMFEEWKESVEIEGFLVALREYLKQFHTPHHCNKFILPGFEREILGKMVCFECGKKMEKCVMYRCCTD